MANQELISTNEKIKNIFSKLNNWAIKNPKIFWPIAIVLLIFWYKFLFKPSVCECNKAAMDYVYKGKGSEKWTECAKSYESEIREYGKRNGQEYVNIYDEGIGYFSENCN